MIRFYLLLALLSLCGANNAPKSTLVKGGRVHENPQSAGATPVLSGSHAPKMPNALSLHPPSKLSNKKSHLKRELQGKAPEIAPLFPGYGTHYAYVYVGTPPQRQSLIVDTGSHWTAFPCTSCKDCGEHTDNPYVAQNSSTASFAQDCGDTGSKRCIISQTYAEGSSWKAFKIQDQIWVGDIQADMLPGGDSYSVNFNFGCQFKETGLFRSQLADGIMGLSNADQTLPQQLKAAKVFDTSTFALCFRVGGGILTLGGVDNRIHEKSDVNYIPMVPEAQAGDFFSVRLANVFVKPVSDNAPVSIASNFTMLKTGAGAILDSGTTDTYLPQAFLKKFGAAFFKLTGVQYTQDDFALTKAQLKQLPDFIFRFKGTDKKDVDIIMPWTDYLDKVEGGKYNFRVYFTETDGVVLGANFMQDHNVIFDAENKRIGFAKAVCNYEPFEPLVYDDSAASIDPWDWSANEANGDCDFVPYTECTARCDKSDKSYSSSGLQDWVNKCEIDAGDVQARPCVENCTEYKIVRGDPKCPDKPWTDCSHACIKSRQAVPKTEPTMIGGKCNYHLQTATCYAGACPLNDGDFLIYLDMRVRVEPWKWSYVYTESFYAAMSQLFNLKYDSIELLNDAGSEYTSGTKLHFKIRLKAKNYHDTKALHDASDSIVVQVRRADFGSRLVDALDSTGRVLDGDHINRFGWLFNEDIEVLSAISMPIGDIRDPYGEVTAGHHKEDKGDDNSALDLDLLLLGVAIAAVLILIVVLYLHMRLRHEHALYAKDKGTLGRGGEALTRMWAQFTSGRGGAGAGEGGSRDREVEMSGLMKTVDEDLED